MTEPTTNPGRRRAARATSRKVPRVALPSCPAILIVAGIMLLGSGLTAWAEVVVTSPVFLIVAKTNTDDWVSGTCFYLQRPSGRWIITANHVVEDAGSGNIATRIGKTWIRLRLVRQDDSIDLAALIPEEVIPFNPYVLRATSAEQGESVAIIGFPIPDVMGISVPTIVRGTVRGYSATPGGIPGFVVEAPAGHGDSGGPVLDNRGQVLGVIVYATGDGSAAYAVHGFHILKLLGETGP